MASCHHSIYFRWNESIFTSNELISNWGYLPVFEYLESNPHKSAATYHRSPEEERNSIRAMFGDSKLDDEAIKSTLQNRTFSRPITLQTWKSNLGPH
jgi:hypothetical protein